MRGVIFQLEDCGGVLDGGFSGVVGLGIQGCACKKRDDKGCDFVHWLSVWLPGLFGGGGEVVDVACEDEEIVGESVEECHYCLELRIRGKELNCESFCTSCNGSADVSLTCCRCA